MSYFRILAVAVLAVAMTGCSTFTDKKHGVVRDRHDDYLQGESVTALKIPKDLDSSRVQDFYPIPPASQEAPAKVPSDLPPGSPATEMINQKAEAKAAKKQSPDIVSSQVTPNAAVTEMTKDADGNVLLTVNEHGDMAWQLLGQALNSAGFRVVTSDRYVNAYFVLDTPATGGVVKKKTPAYQVHVNDEGDKANIWLRNDDNSQVAANTASRILGEIAQQM